MTRVRTGIILFGMSLLPHLARAQPAARVEPFDELSGILISLAAVIGFILIGAWVLRRSPLGAVTRKAGPLKVIATLPLGPKERLVLVEAAGRELLVGVSPAGIFSLNRSDEGDYAGAAASSTAAEQLAGESRDRTLDLTSRARYASESR